MGRFFDYQIANKREGNVFTVLYICTMHTCYHIYIVHVGQQARVAFAMALLRWLTLYWVQFICNKFCAPNNLHRNFAHIWFNWSTYPDSLHVKTCCQREKGTKGVGARLYSAYWRKVWLPAALREGPTSLSSRGRGGSMSGSEGCVRSEARSAATPGLGVSPAGRAHADGADDDRPECRPRTEIRRSLQTKERTYGYWLHNLLLTYLQNFIEVCWRQARLTKYVNTDRQNRSTPRNCPSSV